MRGAAALVCVLVLATAGTARAETATEHVQGYLDRAEAFWADRGGYVNCPQGILVEWQEMDISAGAELGGCRIAIDPARWQAIPSPRWRCLIMLHEYGHLIGLGHAESPNDIMHIGVAYHPTKRCRFGRPLPQHREPLARPRVDRQ